MKDSILTTTEHSCLYITYQNNIKCVKKISKIGKEGILLGKILHPNIIQPIEITETYIIFPFYNGNLRNNGEIITYNILMNICKGLLRAVEYIHSIGIIHADIKPDNILLDGDKSILIDFTSAYEKDDDIICPLTSGGYIAPEVLRYLPFDEKIDIWALGITFLIMIHKSNPLINIPSYKYREILASPPVLMSISSSSEIGSLVTRMLDMNPQIRPTASECIKMLEE